MNLRPGARLFSWSVFPVVMFGSVALSIAIFADGGSEGFATVAGLLFGYTIVIAGLPGFPMTWWAQLCSPWRWDRIKTPTPVS